MQTNTTYGQFEDLFPLMPVPMALIAYHLRALIETLASNAVETPKPKESHAEYSLRLGDGHSKQAEIFGYISPMDQYVRLGFYYGDVLPDPGGLLVSEGKRLRHVKIPTLAAAKQPEIRALIVAAIQERTRTLAPK
jgi:hypothetical protein